MSEEDELINRAVKILRGGGLVAFPTETVYGLGADATNAAAVKRIFDVKGRPATNPLIVHVAGIDAARRYAGGWPAPAEKIARALWPGPITLVVPKGEAIDSQVTAGKSTVGLRVVNHPLTMKLLEKFDGAMAGPSANRSTRTSATTAEHVRKELGTAVDLILDGGACTVGIESTVLDLTMNPPMILRLGAIGRERIEAIIGNVRQFEGSTSSQHAASSPGQSEVHYAPATPAFRFEAGDVGQVLRWRKEHPGVRMVVLAISELALEAEHWMKMPGEVVEYGRRLYAAMREADEMGAGVIWIEMPPRTKEWEAIGDRITRATRKT